MDQQINRTILDNFDVASEENVQHEIYKMNGTEVLKGIENGSLHFITIPREEFIDHTLLPDYITTHGFIIDTMLDSNDGSNNETSQQANPTFVTYNSGQTLVNTNETQLQSNLYEGDKRLSGTLFQLVKGGNIRISGTNNTETQVIVTNKDLINLSGSQIIDTTVKNDNSNSLDTSTFLTFDDQPSLTNSLLNDGQFRIFQPPSPNTHQQTIQVNSPNNFSLPQSIPIRRLNRNLKSSINLNIAEQMTIDNLKDNNEIEQIQSFQQRSTAKKVLPHKKRITKKLKSIDLNDSVDALFQQPDNSTKSPTAQMQYLQDLNEEINAEEVITLNPTSQFACQICGLSAESQLEFFSHLKLHYEPKTESTDIPEISIIRYEPSDEKEFLSRQPQSESQIQMSINQEQSCHYQQLSQIKRQNIQEQQNKIAQNQTKTIIIETPHYQNLPQIRKQIQQNNELSSQSNDPTALITHHSNPEQGYLITNKKIVTTRDLSDVTSFAFENFSQITSIADPSNSNHTVTTKDIGTPHEYQILDSSIENNLQSEDSNQEQISKQTNFLNLQSNDNQHIPLSPRTLLNQTEVVNSKIFLQHQQNQILIPQNRLNKNVDQKSQHSQLVLQNNAVYNQSTIQDVSQVEQNLFGNAQYFETKFTGLPNQVLNLEQKIDAIRAENDISHSISNRTNNIMDTDTLVQSTLICENQNSLHNQIQIGSSETTNETDETENITPSIGQLHEENTNHSNSHKSNSHGIVILEHDEIEFSDPEDMLEGIRSVVDKVQESFDTGDEMEPMTPPRENWIQNSFKDEIVSKSNNYCANSCFETATTVENFQIFFKNEEKPHDHPWELSDVVVVKQHELPKKSYCDDNENNSLSVSAENSLESSKTNSAPTGLEIDNDISVKMKCFANDIEDSSSINFEKNQTVTENNENSSFSNRSKDSSICDKSECESPIPKTEKETLKNCGVLSGKKKKKTYFCDKCLKVFNSSNALKYHDFSHSGAKAFTCEECGKSFFAQNALRAHKRVHSGEKPFTCDECGRAFRQWGDLNYHRISLHSNEKNFQCEFCGKAFARKYSLVIHRRIHTQEKNYKCEFCPKTFRASSYLQNHRKIHTGEKPYECPTCKKKFRVCGDLRRHQKIHDKVNKPKNPKIKIDLEKNEKKAISLDDFITILTDNVINIQTQDDNEKIVNTCDKSIKNEVDLNSPAIMYTPDGNLDQIFKTDNITSNPIKNPSSTLPVNISDAFELTNFNINHNSKNINKLISLSSSESSKSATTLKITKSPKTNQKKTANKIIKKQKVQGS